jgi:hypothetical protein
MWLVATLPWSRTAPPDRKENGTAEHANDAKGRSALQGHGHAFDEDDASEE